MIHLCGPAFPGYDTLLDSATTMLFALLSRCQTVNQADRRSKSNITSILQYIARNCTYVTLAQVAEKFSYNQNYFSVLLHKETGKTFSELLRGFKLKRACTLLEYSELSNEEIALLSGYPHNSNFYKTFKAALGMSPNQYRALKKSDTEQPVTE